MGHEFSHLELTTDRDPRCDECGYRRSEHPRRPPAQTYQPPPLQAYDASSPVFDALLGTITTTTATIPVTLTQEHTTTTVTSSGDCAPAPAPPPDPPAASSGE